MSWKMTPKEWVDFIYYLKPLIEWLIVIAERLFFGRKRGKEKKEFVQTAVNNIFQIPKDQREFNEGLSDTIDNIVSSKNEMGEFIHGA